jgi:hypothetical protein
MKAATAIVLDPNSPESVRYRHQLERRARPGELIKAWHAVFKDTHCTAGEALQRAQLKTAEAQRLLLALQAVFSDWGKPLSPRSLGRWLQLHEYRPLLNGLYFATTAERDHTKLWKVYCQSDLNKRTGR